MKKIIHIILFVIMQGNLFSQNLVPNYSFENIDCPTFTIYNWFSATTGGSPDPYNSCFPSSSLNVPSNANGYQNARTGFGYWGASLYLGNFREYIEAHLNSPMIIGKKYCVEFYVNLSDSSKYACDGFGVYFSNDSISANTSGVLPYIPQVSNLPGNIINDTMNWILMSGNFIADSAYKFITIGNFKDDLNTQSTMNTWGFNACYYFIDDVSVYNCDTILPPQENNIFVPTAFSPNGDGNNDVLFVKGQNIKEIYFTVYDRWGEKVFETQDINQGWDGTFKVEKLNNAVFVYYLSGTYTDGKTFTQKGDISLIR